jgi:hypothetical protein
MENFKITLRKNKKTNVMKFDINSTVNELCAKFIVEYDYHGGTRMSISIYPIKRARLNELGISVNAYASDFNEVYRTITKRKFKLRFEQFLAWCPYKEISFQEQIEYVLECLGRYDKATIKDISNVIQDRKCLEDLFEFSSSKKVMKFINDRSFKMIGV